MNHEPDFKHMGMMCLVGLFIVSSWGLVALVAYAISIVWRALL